MENMRTFGSLLLLLLALILPSHEAAAQPLDPCANNPCLNGGTCSAGPLGPICACAEGWIGDECNLNCALFGDTDCDTVADESDNCPADANTDQANADGDALGDVCDPCPNNPDNLCGPAPLCEVDEHVFGNSCVDCPPGTTNAAGDDASGEDTSCAEIIECAGFEPPMDNYPVRVKKNRALPLKAELFEYEGPFTKTDADLTAPPVVQVMLDGAPSGEGEVSEDALPAGHGSEGNQFVFTDEDKWQFNLKTGHFTAPATYIISMESGDPDAYAFVPKCVTVFEIR